jgi:hypothetical protein
MGMARSGTTGPDVEGTDSSCSLHHSRRGSQASIRIAFAFGRHGGVQPGDRIAQGERNRSAKAWYAALRRAGIEDFRWHDLRHTWASWHVQQGMPQHALQELRGWESSEMVRRYAHFSAEHLAPYADNLCALRVVDESCDGTMSAHPTKQKTDWHCQPLDLTGAPGEIRTPDLLVRSQTLYPTELRARISRLEIYWRRERDSNPRRAFDPYALSRGAPSTTRPSLRSAESRGG